VAFVGFVEPMWCHMLVCVHVCVICVKYHCIVVLRVILCGVCTSVCVVLFSVHRFMCVCVWHVFACSDVCDADL